MTSIKEAGLSNMVRTEGFQLYGLEFFSSEAAYMAGRTDSRELKARLAAIDQNEGAHAVKKFSKTLGLAMDTRTRIYAMMVALEQKFLLPTQKTILLSFDPPFVEDNWWGDTFWGVCKGTGSNYLGKLLDHFHTHHSNGN